MTNKRIKSIGTIAAAAGLAAKIVSDWASEKNMEEIIEKKVSEALARKMGRKP